MKEQLENNELNEDIKFKGTREDRLAGESSNEFHELTDNWDQFNDPVRQLDRWCQHYYGEKFIPINFALKLWEKINDRNKIWPFVKEEFERFKDVLDQHGASQDIIEDIMGKFENK